jgi:hypothetical protein
VAIAGKDTSTGAVVQVLPQIGFLQRLSSKSIRGPEVGSVRGKTEKAGKRALPVGSPWAI